MVTAAQKPEERFVSPPLAFLSGRWKVPRFTRHDAEALMRIGVVPEDASTELLDGMIVLKDRAAAGQDPAMIGVRHTKCVEKLSDLRVRINSPLRHVRSQQPLFCTETHVPEPDFMVIRGTLDDYADLPRASDALGVIEVADASYERDTGEKLVAYAKAGVVHYMVLDLRQNLAELFTQPDQVAGRFDRRSVIGRDSVLPLFAADDAISVLLRDVLP